MQVCWNSNLKDFEQQKRRDHQAQDQSKSAKQKRDRLNPPDWSQVTKAGWNMLDSISEKGSQSI